ncbi:MAG: hypothetical protein WCP52_06275 [Bacteroidota bacterium]
MKPFIICIIFILCFGFISKAQHTVNIDDGGIKISDEAEAKDYKLANQYFNDGEYVKCISLLEKYSKEKGSFNKVEYSKICELLAKSYIEADEIDKADEQIQRLYQTNILYEVINKENTPEDFYRELKKFTVHPLITIGVRDVLVFPKLKSTKTYSVLDNVDYSASYDHVKYFNNYHAFVEYQPKDRQAFRLEFSYWSLDYSRTLSKPNWNLNYNEKLSFAEFPLYGRVYLADKKFILFMDLGFGYSRLFKANASVSLNSIQENIYTGEQTQKILSEFDIDMRLMRNLNLLEGIYGVGFGGRLGNWRLSFDLRQYKGFTSVSNSKKRFDNPTLTNDFYYIDNSFRLNRFEMGLAISYTIKNSIKKQ